MTPTFKSKVLEFDLMGEGNLPSVCVVRPALRNSGGGPMLQFGRVLVGRRHTLPLVLLNDGNVPAQVRGDIFLCPFSNIAYLLTSILRKSKSPVFTKLT